MRGRYSNLGFFNNNLNPVPKRRIIINIKRPYFIPIFKKERVNKRGIYIPNPFIPITCLENAIIVPIIGSIKIRFGMFWKRLLKSIEFMNCYVHSKLL